MESNHEKSRIANCRILQLPRHEDPNGSLTEVENTGAFPFEVKRVFYLYDVPAGSERGGHSHRDAHEMIVAVSGAFSVTVTDGKDKKTYRLDRPYQALYIEPGIWRTLDDFSASSVCLVLTSEKYSEQDYVRSFDDFLEYTKSKRGGHVPVKYPFLDLKKTNEPYFKPLKEVAARVIESGYYIGGAEVEALEQEMAAVAGTPYAVGVSNGLDALRLIFRAYIELGRLSPGDEVIVPADTYIASILAVTDNGLKPVFVEPSINTYNLDTALIEQAITTRTRAILPVHLYGRLCWDETLRDLAQKHGLIVVEDVAQAIGATSWIAGLYGSSRAGGLGDAGAFSFYPTKNVGALGDAGCVATHDQQLADAVRALRNYGSDRQYHNIYAGWNCRLDPMQAALLRVKLPFVDQENAHRTYVARAYDLFIHNSRVAKPQFGSGDNVWHQYVVRVDDRDAFRKYLLDNGVETAVHYPLAPHRQPCYQEYADLHLPIADEIARTVVSLPINSGVSVNDARAIAKIINRYR